MKSVCNKLQINITFSHVYGNHDDECLLDDLPLLEKINVEFDIRAKEEIRANVGNNAPITPGIPYDPTFYKIYGIKITESVGKLLRKKTSHK